MNLISCLERGLSTYFSIRFEPGDNFSALVDLANLNRSGIYIVWNVTGDIPSWLIDTQGVVYIGKSLCLQKRVKASNHHVIRPLRYLEVGFTISFIFAEESELDLLESSTILAYQPPFNVAYNFQESVAPRSIYWLLPYICKTKGDLDKAVTLYAQDFPTQKFDLLPFIQKIRVFARSSVHTLHNYKECGNYFLKIKEALQGASLKNPVSTPIGEFTSFDDFLNNYPVEEGETRVSRSKVYNYIKLWQHWDILQQLHLDKLNACYRLDITTKIIFWAIKKRDEEGIDLSELDHHLYFQENSERIQKNRELNKERERLVRSELKELRVERDYYKSQFQELKSKLDKILSAYPELAEL